MVESNLRMGCPIGGRLRGRSDGWIYYVTDKSETVFDVSSVLDKIRMGFAEEKKNSVIGSIESAGFSVSSVQTITSQRAMEMTFGNSDVVVCEPSNGVLAELKAKVSGSVFSADDPINDIVERLMLVSFMKDQ